MFVEYEGFFRGKWRGRSMCASVSKAFITWHTFGGVCEGGSFLKAMPERGEARQPERPGTLAGVALHLGEEGTSTQEKAGGWYTDRGGRELLEGRWRG